MVCPKQLNLSLTTNDNFETDHLILHNLVIVFKFKDEIRFKLSPVQELLGTAERIPTASKNLENFKKNFQPSIKPWKYFNFIKFSGKIDVRIRYPFSFLRHVKGKPTIWRLE